MTLSTPLHFSMNLGLLLRPKEPWQGSLDQLHSALGQPPYLALLLYLWLDVTLYPVGALCSLIWVWMLKGRNGLLWYKDTVFLHSPASWGIGSKPHLIMAIIATTWVVYYQVLTAFNSLNNLARKSYYNSFLREKEIEACEREANDLPKVTQLVSGSDRI